jgi:D-3-phosphoglycerate dehydrogenase / 2-oxoglutarate reductase
MSEPTAAEPIVLIVDDYVDPELFAATLGPGYECRAGAANGAADGAADRVRVLVTGSEPIGAAEIEPYPELRLVVTCSVGFDHLDLPLLEGRGIAARNTPTYCTAEVADHALTCVLAGWRGLDGLHRDVLAGGWDHTPAGVLRRFDESRLAILGYGRIGRALGRRAAALGIDVVAHDPYIEAEAADGVPMLALDAALADADAVSLHIPGTPGTPPVLGARELALMKPGAVLVNVSRASLVDLDAMLAALRERRLMCAYWDVWPEEPPQAGDARLAAPGLIVTPHAAWYSADAEAGYTREAVAAIHELVG